MTLPPVIIVNPHAGQKAGIKTNSYDPADLQSMLDRHGLHADLWLTEHSDHATELARQAAREGRPVAVAAGGDGTVAEVAAGLIDGETKLGILPLGSIMNMARMLGIPRDLERAAEVIKVGNSVRIDAGRATTAVGQRIFLEGAGVGVTAAIFAYSNQLDSGNWRSLLPLLKFLLRYRPRRVIVDVDGKKRRARATMVAVANGPLLGAAFEMAPGARLDDRLLTVRVFSALNRGQLIGQVWSIVRHVSFQSGVLTDRGRVVEVDGERRRLMVHADSHPLGTTPARFELLPAALSVLVPEVPDCSPALAQAGGRVTSSQSSVFSNWLFTNLTTEYSRCDASVTRLPNAQPAAPRVRS